MRKKLRDSGGLTLVETLCAAVILALLCLMMNTGLHAAVRSYRAITSESEVRLLLSSLSDALADKLRYCVVTVDGSGAYRGCSVGEVTAEADGMVRVGGSKLLPDGAYGEKTADGSRTYQAETLSITPSIESSTGTAIFQIDLTVKDVSLDTTETTGLTVRCLNPVKKEGAPP